LVESFMAQACLPPAGAIVDEEDLLKVVFAMLKWISMTCFSACTSGS
jgi:hypothetical protein